jgi:hypothetical protein
MAEAKTVLGWAALAALWVAAPAAAQTISPGMSTAQVRATLGAPFATRQTDGWTYLYYRNGCAPRCGSDDVVFVQGDRVVAAVFRGGQRRFAGPAAAQALAGTSGAGRPSADAVEVDQAPPARMRVRDGARDEPGRTVTGRPGAEPAARVGGVRVEAAEGGAVMGGSGVGSTTIRRGDGEGTTTIRVDEGSAGPPARAGSREATRTRTQDALPDDRNRITGTGVDSPENDVAAVDSARGAPATAVDDERRARENRIEPNTVRTPAQPAGAVSPQNADRRERERNVVPRVVPRP